MADHRIDEDQENHNHHQDQILLLTYPCAVYYVQSPSTHSSNTDFRNHDSGFDNSPYRSENYISSNHTPTNNNNTCSNGSRFLLSRYSPSSRGSNNSFVHEKKITYEVHDQDNFNENGIENDDDNDEDDDPCLRLCEKNKQKNQGKLERKKYYENDELEDYYDDDEVGDDRKLGFWRFFSFGTYNSWIWISIQILWRILVSFGAALFVFYLATKPPTPKMSIKMAGIPQFGLGEGVDGSGVATKILNCNCSMALEVNNKSKLFGLHIHPSTIKMSFGPLIFASTPPTSQDSELYAENDKLTRFKLYVGTTNRAMYGAGRSMQDMLESGKGLPLMIKMNLRSNFHVVWNFVKPKFSHHVECSLILHGSYGKPVGRTQAYNSHCKIITTSI